MPAEPPGLSLSLQQPDGRHRRVLARHKVARWIRAAIDAPAEITVRIVDEAEGRALNRDFRAKAHATNVLTFDYAQEPIVVADLVLCAPVVAREAREQGITLAGALRPPAGPWRSARPRVGPSARGRRARDGGA